MSVFHFILTLPVDLKKRRQLNIKLRQYEERMMQSLDAMSGGNPYYYLARSRHYLMRAMMLSRLLRNGWVDLGDVLRDLIKSGSITEFDEPSFFAAAAVIIDYVAFNGENLHGGLGLPDIKD
jgi:hypothetical protein